MIAAGIFIVCSSTPWMVAGSFFFFKQKTAYEMRISDWSSDVCSSDLQDAAQILIGAQATPRGIAFADVAYNPTASAGIRRISRSLICLNPQKDRKSVV